MVVGSIQSSSAISESHLHFSPTRWHDLGIVHPHFSLWHLVETLQDDMETLSHLLHSTQIPAASQEWWGGHIEGYEIKPINQSVSILWLGIAGKAADHHITIR